MKYLQIILLLLSFSGNAQKLFEVDGYPVTDEMINALRTDPSFKMETNGIYSYDKAWFANGSLHQALVFELYTDGHRLITRNFYTNDIPEDLAGDFEFNLENGDMASSQQTHKALPLFLQKAKNIPKYYFKTEKGLQLGDTKQTALLTYSSKPDNITVKNGIEKYVWEFPGDYSVAEGHTVKNGKPVAKDSFGHRVTLFFREDKLIGIILFNDIP